MCLPSIIWCSSGLGNQQADYKKAETILKSSCLKTSEYSPQLELVLYNILFGACLLAALDTVFFLNITPPWSYIPKTLGKFSFITLYKTSNTYIHSLKGTWGHMDRALLYTFRIYSIFTYLQGGILLLWWCLHTFTIIR